MKLKLSFLISALFSIFITHANENVELVLNNFHKAASDANYQKYFGLLADNAVFIGTDVSERWTKKQFSQYVKPYFSKGIGWTYTATKRNTTVLNDGKTAFFDELLWNDKYGQCRGTGTLAKVDGHWKILQYSLSIPIPNARAKNIVDIIQQDNN